MKTRTGSWRVVQILATALATIWIGGFLLVWFGFVPPSAVQVYIPMGIPIIVVELVYLNLYSLPKRKRSP